MIVSIFIAVGFVLFLVLAAWVPIFLGIQAVHHRDGGRPLVALGLITIGVGFSLIVNALVFSTGLRLA